MLRIRGSVCYLYSPNLVEEKFSEVRQASGVHIWSLMSTITEIAPAQITARQPKSATV